MMQSLNKKARSLRILEVCPYSSGGCGVWNRVKLESLEFAKKGHEVRIFSSNFEKGTDKIIPQFDQIGDLRIYRFKAKKLGGESFMTWLKKDGIQKGIEFSPDIIIAHGYRHPHTTSALKIKKALNRQNKKCKIFLVTHAPFVEGNITRTPLQSLAVKFYDLFLGRFTLNKFDKILSISHWEKPYLLSAGAREEKITYIPNGIPKEFFSLKPIQKEENKVLFLGRIAPKKKIETIIDSIPLIKNKKTIFEFVGPEEEDYKNFLNDLIKKTGTQNRIVFSPPVYEIKNKIGKLDSCKIYILASRVEGMPQGLIEAMARGKIVVGSNSLAIRDIIKNNENGYLFEFNNPSSLAEVLNSILDKNKESVSKKGKEFVIQFSWDKIIKTYENLFK